MINQIQSVLKELEQLPQEQYWNVGPEVGQFLTKMAESISAKKILEVGTSNGYSAIWFAMALLKTDGHLWTVESNDKRYQEAAINLNKAGVSHIVTQIKGHAPEVFSDLSDLDSVDLAFLDATKAEYVDHLEAVLPLLSPKGIVIADNIRTHFDKVQSFIELATQLPNYDLEYKKDFGTGLIILVPKQKQQSKNENNNYPAGI